MSTVEHSKPTPANLGRDFISGIVVFLVALPLCLGIAVASGADPYAGILAGIIGGIVIGSMSGSHTSVSGPAAGLTAIVIVQITNLGFEGFLFAVLLAGVFQVVLGLVRGGELSAFFPTSVIKGLLAAIGVILILKQIPHLLGDDKDPEGEMSFEQPDHENTFSELWSALSDPHWGALLIGLVGIAFLFTWDRIKPLKNSLVPAPLLVVVIGVLMQLGFRNLGESMKVDGSHLVELPVAENLSEFIGNFTFPNLGTLNTLVVDDGQLVPIIVASFTIAIVASLETLLNLEAVDKLDQFKRNSPPSRELVAQGVGNMIAGCVGALPMTSVIVRSSVNVHSGSRTKFSAIFHGFLLLICVAFFPRILNMIPLSALAAILIVTGFKLASPKLIAQMWKEGRYQFVPFIVTLVAIVLTDLLIGILIGLGISVLFILNSNLRRPVRRIVETHLDGDVVHIELANQVSFLNKAALDKLLNGAEPGSRLLIDATDSDYMDPDVLALIRDFKDNVAPKRNIQVSLRGFRDKYQLKNEVQFADYSTRELKDKVTPAQVLEFLKNGNRRFREGKQLTRDFSRQVDGTKSGQNPLAVILSCIDSRVPAELVFDLGIGDIFSVRVAGNIIGTKSLGSIEFGVVVSGVKVLLVLGHTRCGAVTSSVDLLSTKTDVLEATGCPHLPSIVGEVQPSVTTSELQDVQSMGPEQKEHFVDEIARRNVTRTVAEILSRSQPIRAAVDSGKAIVVGALYDVKSGAIEFLVEESAQASKSLSET